MTSPTPQEDALLTLAFSMRANPGAYAVLVGAGVSAPSGILTAWGVVNDLISKIAFLTGEPEPADPARWYLDRYGEPARYESLLEKLAPSPLERQRLLREYFEPADPESGSEDKKPTLAHKAIARLVKQRIIRVLVTLNFDRLLEQAIRAQGIEPTIVASAGDVHGLAPLHTLDCCIVHLHGDYLNPSSMRNTTLELDAYDPEMLDLLHRILKDYGLIIAGWSATFDPALMDAIKAHYPARYTLAWVEPRPQSEPAKEFRTLMNGHLVPTDADTAFGRLVDAVTSLSTRRARHPLTVPVAVDTAKRELSGRWVAIGLHDTLAAEFERLRSLPELNLSNYGQEAPDGYAAMVQRVEEGSKVPVALVAALAYWGDEKTDEWWVDEIERFSRQVRASGITRLITLPMVAGSALFYAAGIAALAGRRYRLLNRLLNLRRQTPYRGEYEPLAEVLEADSALEGVPQRHYEFLRPLMLEALSLGSEPLDDFWQQFEILRTAKLLAVDSSFRSLVPVLRRQDDALSEAKDAYDEAGAAGTPLDDVRVARAEAARGQGRVLGQIANSVHLHRPHLFVTDARGDFRWHSPVAERLVRELDAERENHPLVQESLGSANDLSMAIRAVSAAAGQVGHNLTFGRSGAVPDQIWIDTGKTPHELAQER